MTTPAEQPGHGIGLPETPGEPPPAKRMGPVSFVRELVRELRTAPDRPQAIRALILLTAAALLVVLCVGGIAWRLIAGPEPNGAGAREACREYIRSRLIEPDTAKFSEIRLSGADRHWTVTGVLTIDDPPDAPWDFDFTCIAEGEGDSWSVVRLTPDL